MKTLFEVWRGRPGEGGRFREYTLEVEDDRPLVDVLEILKLGPARDLLYRHSCHHASCGTCTILVNGREALACVTTVAQAVEDGLERDDLPVVRLEPLHHLAWAGDLATDPDRLFHERMPEWTHLREAEAVGELPEGIEGWTRFEDCIECGACVSACPVATGFTGPAALAAMNRHREKTGDPEMLKLAADPRGAAGCERFLLCSRACPSGVYPAKHIQILKRELRKKEEAEGR